MVRQLDANEIQSDVVGDVDTRAVEAGALEDLPVSVQLASEAAERKSVIFVFAAAK